MNVDIFHVLNFNNSPFNEIITHERLDVMDKNHAKIFSTAIERGLVSWEFPSHCH